MCYHGLMATKNLEITKDPKNVVTELTLAVGTTYDCQFVGGDGLDRLTILESATVPDDTSPSGHSVLRYEAFRVKPKSGEGVYVWAQTSGKLAVTEAP